MEWKSDGEDSEMMYSFAESITTVDSCLICTQLELVGIVVPSNKKIHRDFDWRIGMRENVIGSYISISFVE